MNYLRKFLPVLLWLAVIAPGAMAQVPVDETTKKVTYKEVVNQEGVPSKMYNQGISWVNSQYVNAADATRVRDAENARIEIRHRIRIYEPDKDGNLTTKEAPAVQYDLILEFKENRYRYTVNEFVILGSSRIPMEKWLDKKDPGYKPVYDNYIQQVDKTVNEIIKSLKEGMKPKVVKEDNW